MSEIAEIVEQKDMTVVGGDSILAVIGRAASDPTVDVDKLERMMAMYERMESKKAEMAFDAAMSEAQSEIKPISANMENKQTRSKYASYDQLDKIIRPIYTAHGFALSFNTGEASQDFVKVICHVSHRSGYSRDYQVDMPADGKGAKGGDVMTKTHATGSALSYGSRYLLKLIFNVAIGDDDDDGNKGGLPRVTEQQAATIQALMEEVGADLPRMLKYFKVESIEGISAQAFDDVIKMLEAKRKK